MSKNIALSTLLIIIISILQTINSTKIKSVVPPKSSFIPIIPYKKTKITLNDTQQEAYFTYDNKNENSDFIMQLDKGNALTLHMYIYERYEDIKVTSSGNYTNFTKEIPLIGKDFYIKHTDMKIKRTNYYIIIKDIGDYKDSDYISLFNEGDEIPFRVEEPFIYKKFCSKNKYILSFNGNITDIFYIKLDTNNQTFERNLKIFLDNKMIVDSIKTRGLITVNEKQDKKGKYRIEISSEEKPYDDILGMIMLSKQNRNVLKLEPNIPLNLNYHGIQKFSFFIDINKYDLGEENIVTFLFDKKVKEERLLKYAYAWTKNLESDSDKILSQNLPDKSTKNEAQIHVQQGSDTIFHLYFNKTQFSLRNLTSYLLIQLSLAPYYEEKFMYPQKILVTLGERKKNFDLSTDENINVKNSYKLLPYTAMTFGFKMKNGNNNKGYAFYADKFVLSFFKSLLMGKDHTQDKIGQIFAIKKEDIVNSDNKERYIYFTAKLFSHTEENINFRIESTDNDIYYENNVKREKIILNKELLNCEKSFYYIGDYSLGALTNYFFIEKLYGNFDIFFKNQITSEDKSIFTNSNDIYKSKLQYGHLNNNYHIIEVKCTFPGYVNIHVFNHEKKQESIDLYTRTLGFIKKSTQSTFSLIPYNETIYLEISSPLGNSLEVDLETKKILINSTNFVHREKFSSNAPGAIKITALKEDSIFSLRYTNVKYFDRIDRQGYTNKESAIINISKNETFKGIKFEFNHVMENYGLSLYKGDPDYACLPLNSNYIAHPGFFNIKQKVNFSNPLKKYPQNSFSDGDYYIVLQFNNTEKGVQKHINLTYLTPDKYEILPTNSPKTLSKENKKIGIKSEEKLNKITFFYRECANTFKGLSLYNFDDKIGELAYNKANKINYKEINNYKIDMQVQIEFNPSDAEYEGAQVGYTYDKIDEKYIDSLNKKKYNITNNKKSLSWEKIDKAVEYNIFVFHVNTIYEKLLSNPCFLGQIKVNSSYLLSKNDTSYINSYKTTENKIDISESGLHKIVISAKLSHPFTYIFDAYKFDSNKENEEFSYLWLYIAIPLILVVVIATLVFLIKKRQPEIEIPEEPEKLIRDSNLSGTDNSHDYLGKLKDDENDNDIDNENEKNNDYSD